MWDVPAFATGAAFTNGIVSRPTRFNIGEMGEAGSEGILPLANIGGRLGVHAMGVGGGGNTERLERLVEALTGEVQRLQSVVAEGNRHSKTTADAMGGATEGYALRVVLETP